jgi:GxxExxY protein
MSSGLSPDALTKLIIGFSMKVHSTLGPGFVEFVYRNSLLVEMRRANLSVQLERQTKVFYEGVVVGEFFNDVVVDGWLILELKAVANLTKEHEVKMVNYLTATEQDFGLLINFGAESLQFKRKYRRRKPQDPLDPPNLSA